MTANRTRQQSSCPRQLRSTAPREDRLEGGGKEGAMLGLECPQGKRTDAIMFNNRKTSLPLDL